MLKSESTMTTRSAFGTLLYDLDIYHVTLFHPTYLFPQRAPLAHFRNIYNDHPAARGFVWLAVAMSALLIYPEIITCLHFSHSLNVVEE